MLLITGTRAWQLEGNPSDIRRGPILTRWPDAHRRPQWTGGANKEPFLTFLPTPPFLPIPPLPPPSAPSSPLASLAVIIVPPLSLPLSLQFGPKAGKYPRDSFKRRFQLRFNHKRVGMTSSMTWGLVGRGIDLSVALFLRTRVKLRLIG